MDPNPQASVESDPDPLRVKRKTLEAVLLQCQRALELINATSSTAADVDEEDCEIEGEATASADPDADEVTLFLFPFLGFPLVRNFNFLHCVVLLGSL